MIRMIMKLEKGTICHLSIFWMMMEILLETMENLRYRIFLFMYKYNIEDYFERFYEY